MSRHLCRSGLVEKFVDLGGCHTFFWAQCLHFNLQSKSVLDGDPIRDQSGKVVVGMVGDPPRLQKGGTLYVIKLEVEDRGILRFHRSSGKWNYKCQGLVESSTIQIKCNSKCASRCVLLWVIFSASIIENIVTTDRILESLVTFESLQLTCSGC